MLPLNLLLYFIGAFLPLWGFQITVPKGYKLGEYSGNLMLLLNKKGGMLDPSLLCPMSPRIPVFDI